jgi:hypothetical protein
MTAYLHDLGCTNDPCRCRVLYRVTVEQEFEVESQYTEGDSVTVESRTAPGRDHPPARGRFASSRVIR